MHKIVFSHRLFLSEKHTKKLFWDIQEWHRVWEPIYKVSATYDDGYHQEFIMDLVWQEVLHQIRTVRYQQYNSIIFFSPKPPPPMLYHAGSWNFFPISEMECLVQGERNYILSKECDEAVFQEKFSKRLSNLLNQFAEKIRLRGNFNDRL